jgi:hypothetical protein
VCMPVSQDAEQGWIRGFGYQEAPQAHGQEEVGTLRVQDHNMGTSSTVHKKGSRASPNNNFNDRERQILCRRLKYRTGLVSPPVKSSRRPLRTHKSQKDLCCLRGCWERRTGGPGGACCSSLNQTNHPVSVLHVPSPGVVVAHAQRAKVFCPKKVVDFCACARVAASSAACVVEDVGGGRCRVGDRGFDFPLAVFQFVGLKQKLGSGKIN